MITITYKSCQGRNTDYLVDSRYEKALEQNKHLKLPFSVLIQKHVQLLSV